MRAILAGSVLGIAAGLVLNAHAATPLPTHDDWGIAYTPYQIATMDLAHDGAYGPILNPGPDAGILTEQGQYVQLEFIPCLSDPDARWFEDGTAVGCLPIADWQGAHIDAVRAHVEETNS